MLERLQIVLRQILYILPKHSLTQFIGWIANREISWLTRLMVTLFVRAYKVNMQEVQQPDIATYRTFNEFFVRSMRNEVRPIDKDPNILVLPADGIISHIGVIDSNQILQAKGHKYSLEALLAGNDRMIDDFHNGCFTVIYLAPRDYHRVHMPCNGTLREMIYVPGDLFPINAFAVANIPNLFARNERVICLFDTDFGPIAQILIGATIVGSIETIWAGTVTPPREGIIKCWRYPHATDKGAIAILKGHEMGCFKLGSTVINLFAEGHILLCEHLHPSYVTRVGQPLAHGMVLTDSPHY